MLGIAGTGLIGGSIGLRARECGMHVIGFDADSDAASEAVRCGAIESAVSREDLYRRSEIVVLAMHSQGTIAELERLKREGGCSAPLLIDVASVKAPIARAGKGLPNFVPTHPMAGAESSGPGAAKPQLFSDRPWLYVPSGDAQLDERAVQFITLLGGRAVPVDAEEHDALVAMTSHVPQVFASAFTRHLQSRYSEDAIAPFCGPVARELLRLGGSSNAMWRDIFLSNGNNIAYELEALAHDLLATAQDLRQHPASTSSA